MLRTTATAAAILDGIPPEAVVDAATGSTGTEPIAEPEALGDCSRTLSCIASEVVAENAAAIPISAIVVIVV